jgi:LCP family protein required for cell wall assembly
VRFSPGARRRWPRRILVGVNLFVAACLVGTVSVYAYVRYRVGQINTVNVAGLRGNGSTPATQPFTMLVVGSDSRALTGANNAEFGTEAETPGQRSDTVMLVRVMPAAHQLSILSIPRDLYVPIAGMGTQRINAAFDSGANLLVSTITADLGIPIDHYVEVNFDTFRQITDAVGGVKFWFPTPARDQYSLLGVPAGCVNLTGNQALAFVRSRHYEYYANGQWNYQAESDLARIQRQQAFVKKMIKKAEGEFTNPLALNDIIGAVTKNLTVDQGFSNTSFILGLTKQLRSVDASSIPSETIPTYGFTTSAGAEVLGLQQPQASQMIAAFNALGNPPGAAVSPGTSAGSGSSGSSATTIAPSSISVEVANGTGVTGQATQAVADLTAAGYNATVDTTPGSNFTTNMIRYAPDSLAAAKQLQSQLAGGATLAEDSSLTATSFNLELITGQDFNGLTSSGASTSAATSGGTTSALLSAVLGLSALTLSQPGGATLTSSASSTTTPASPPVTQYVLPGTPPGQLPPASCN